MAKHGHIRSINVEKANNGGYTMRVEHHPPKRATGKGAKAAFEPTPWGRSETRVHKNHADMVKDFKGLAGQMTATPDDEPEGASGDSAQEEASEKY